MVSRAWIVFALCVGPIWGGTIEVAPTVLTVSNGQVFSLDVNVDSVIDLYAYQFDLNFDASVLQAVSETEGSFLSSGGSTFFIPGVIDNTNGYFSGTADSLEAAIPGVSGSGTLVEFTFQAIGSGSTPIDITNVYLLDSNLSGIDAGVTNGDVLVEPTVPTPEPSYGPLLLVLGAVALVFGRRFALPAERWQVGILVLVGEEMGNTAGSVHNLRSA